VASNNQCSLALPSKEVSKNKKKSLISNWISKKPSYAPQKDVGAFSFDV